MMRMNNHQKVFQLIAILLFLIPAILWIGSKSALECSIFSSLDDGHYYPKIAQNFAKSGVITYDNVTITNGFHPLWQALIIPIFFIFPGTMAGLKAVYFFLILIGLANVFLFLKICNKLDVNIAGIFLGMFILFLNFRTFTLWFSLLETPLVLLTVQALLLLWLNWKGLKKNFLFGLCAGFVFLARTDNVFLIAILGISIILIFAKKEGFSRSIQEAFKYTAGATIPVIPYFTLNLIYFGRILPVSGARKIGLHGNLLMKIPEVLKEFIWFWTSRIGYYLGISNTILYAVLGIASVSIIIALIWLNKKGNLHKTKDTASYMTPFIVAAIFHYVFIATFMQKDAVYSTWYLVQEILVITVLLSSIITDITGAVKQAYRGYINYTMATSVTILLLLQLLIYPSYYVKRCDYSYELAEYIKDNTTQDALFTAYDSGRLSYFSERNFIAANGLIGDYELAKFADSENSFQNIIVKYDVDWVVLICKEERYDQFKDRFVYSSESFLFGHRFYARYVMFSTEDFSPLMLE